MKEVFQVLMNKQNGPEKDILEHEVAKIDKDEAKKALKRKQIGYI